MITSHLEVSRGLTEVLLNATNRTTIRGHALEEYPRECCGLVVSTNEGAHEFLRCQNISSAPEKHFAISPVDYVKASARGEIIGTYHSHPEDSEAFSEFDKFNSEIHKLTYILYCLKKNIFLEYNPDCEFNQYIGRQFKIGKTDCFSLVKDFFAVELKIKLNNYLHLRAEGWRDNLEELFDKNYMNEGFVKVDGEHKKYDCHLFKYKNKSASQHMAVNLGGNLMLHQPLNGPSRIEELTEKHKKFINYTIRHKDLL